ncbi:MAG: helicase [Mucilaginibacter sp.]|nr:helicase [Mucilaginibacter sp.]
MTDFSSFGLMQETIQARLESSRKELLDLGLRNPLLNYKITKGKGVHIVDEKAEFIYDILVRQQKAMTFLALKEGQLFPEGEEKYVDTRLQTDEDEQKLQSRLLNTYYFARTSIEEQGVNLLYLALGMLRWYDAGDTETLRSAPLVLVPVALERSSAQERFRLRYTGSEIGANLSLQAKMKSDFNLSIPDMPEAEEFVFNDYINDIRSHIAKEANWSIDTDAIELGFFSFGKFLIYNDLDTGKWPKTAKPENHPNVTALLETGFHEDILEDEHDLDADTKANELFRVVDADSSQLLAMLAVQDGGNLVIQGPPGTGKSQTITNIIANAVGQGKKVLFVAEKMAALDVVKRRLDNIDLGMACLELHSHKTNKRDVLQELKRVLELGKPQTAKLELEIQMLEIYRTELNDYCRAINHQLSGSGTSAQQVIGFLLLIDQQTKGRNLMSLPIENISNWSAEEVRLAEEWADRIQARLTDIGKPSDLVFYGSKLMLVLPHDKGAILQRMEGALRAVTELLTLLNHIRESTGFAIPVNETELPALEDVLAKAAEAPDLSALKVSDPIWQTKAEDIKELLSTGEELEGLYRNYKDTFVAEAWSQEVLEIRRNIVTYGDKWYRNLNGGYRKSKQQLAALLKVTLPPEANEKLKLVDAISEARRLEHSLQQYDSFAITLFGNRWLKQRSDWRSLHAAAAYLAEIKNPVLIAYLNKLEPTSIAANYLTALKGEVKMLNEQRDQALHALEIEKFPIDYVDQETAWKNWIEHFDELQLAIDWNQLCVQTEKEGLIFLTQAATNRDEAKDLLKISLQKTWYEYLIGQAFRRSPELSKFERASHEEIISKFKKLDQINLYYNRAMVALKHWEGLPKGNAGGQVNILKTEFNKKIRHMPIRKLVEEAGKAMQAIKPVWMMSPMSIANFLPPGAIDFDLVIFDEASQVRPVDAIGAIARGKQLVVVGDTRQLPPTSFFDKLNTDIEEEDNVTADMQSILGMCDGQGAPTRMLKWHYRSQHESLITLSNHEFYEDKLVIFPSPGSRQNLGLRFHHLPEAIYDRGKTRTNPMEAEAVAKAVIRHASKYPNQSLGVVAFSTAQAQAIQASLEIERKASPATETYFTGRPDEPFFIKNLENVQGDERDVILISIGYGRTEEGKVPMNFGPLNNEGGERRLNVLITRAKMRCEVFTNITSEDIKVSESARFGIRALKSFLYFAQFAKFDKPEAIIPNEVRPFEEEVAAQLTRAGHIVRDKVGSPGFYLDLAIVDPENPGRYLLGLICDGQAYDSAASATDRDRLRTQVLELFGWNLYQVWSADWYRNPSRELNRLLTTIEQAKLVTEAIDKENDSWQQELSREVTTESKFITPEYQLAEIHIEHIRPEFQLYTFHELGTWIAEIVQIEGPVHFDEMAKRITDAAGVAKLGSRIRYTLTQALHQAQEAGKVIQKGEFLWAPEKQTPVVRDRSKLPPAYKKLTLVAPEEIYEAIRQVVSGAIAIAEQEAIPLVAKLLGFSRVTDDMKQQLSEAIGKTIQNGILTFEGVNLKRME